MMHPRKRKHEAHYMEDQLSEINEARAAMGLTTLVVKERICTMCRNPFMSIEKRRCYKCAEHILKGHITVASLAGYDLI